jgi:hypothetical protein
MPMNLIHRKICSSAKWADTVEERLTPWLAKRDLGDDVLEIGPGFGATTKVLLDVVPKLTILEIDPASTALLRAEFGDRADVHEGSGAEMPFADGRFSAVVCFTMLHHVPTTALQDAIFAVLLVWQAFRFALHAAPQPARERLALVAAALWCLYPATGILVMPYTEALACVLVPAALLLLMRREYLWVGVVALALGFTRGVAPALACAALAHLVIRWREDRAAGLVPLRGQRASALLMLAATAVSAVAWPVLVGVASGLPTAFFDVQAAWGQQPDKGPFVLWVAWAWDERGFFGLAVLLALVGTYVALVLGRHGRWLAIELRAWALAYPLYLMAVVRPITSMWRFLLLDFPIAALVASVAMRTSTGASVVSHWRRRVAVVVVALVLGVFWFTAALLTFTPWDAAPP